MNEKHILVYNIFQTKIENNKKRPLKILKFLFDETNILL